MVEKRIIDNINESIPSSKNYKSIESKLDFNSFQAGSTPNVKTKKPLRLIMPISAICITIVVAAIVIPVTLSKKNNRLVLNPISNEMMSFYLENTSFNGSGDIPQGTSVGGLYNTYKQRPEKMAELAQRKEIFTLSGENQFHCYYATKEVYDKVNEQLNFPPAEDSLIPYRSLTAYFDGYKNGNWSEELKCQQLMETIISSNENYVETRIEGYYLLDIVRYYHDPNIDNFSFIGFANHDTTNNNQALIKKDVLKDSFKYFSCTFVNPNKFVIKANYNYLSILDFHSVEITKEGSKEVVLDTFGYLRRDDAHYYDELNDCIVRKTFVESYANCDFYNVTFDYDKLVKLFGF